MSDRGPQRQLTPEQDARILRAYQHMVREGDKLGAVKSLAARFGRSAGAISVAIKRALARQHQVSS